MKQVTALSESFKNALAVDFMYFAVVRVKMRQEKQLKAALDVVFAELELGSDEGHLFVVEIGAVFERFTVEEILLEAADRLEEAVLKD